MESFFLDPTKLWILFSFVVFVGIAYKMGKSSVLNVLDTRIADIRKNLEDAENLHVEAQELLAQYQRKHKDAVQDAENIIHKAQKQADEIKKQAEADLTASNKRREKQLKDRIKRMENAAIEEIRQYAAELALDATSQIVNDKLGKAANDALVDASIKEIGKNIK